jgi:uncharacterized lipoprotein YbaY
MRREALLAAAVLLEALCAACAGAPPAEPGRAARTPLVGTWVRAIRGGMPGREGLSFRADGTLGLVGIHSMHGLRWDQGDDGSLVLTTNTGRYPEPLASRLHVAALDAAHLELAGSGYLAGSYERDDAAAGWITGTASYRQRTALPPDAVLHLTLRATEGGDSPARRGGIAFQTIPSEGRQVPIPFWLCYATADLDPRGSYVLDATLSAGDSLLFRTDDPPRVATQGHASEVELVLDPVTAVPGAASPPHAYRCQGNEPFWDLDVDGTHARYRSLGEALRERHFDGTPRWLHESGTAGLEWQGRERDPEQGRLVLSIREEICLDTMSDETPPFPARIRVELPDGSTLDGCCRTTPPARSGTLAPPRAGSSAG